MGIMEYQAVYIGFSALEISYSGYYSSLFRRIPLAFRPFDKPVPPYSVRHHTIPHQVVHQYSGEEWNRRYSACNFPQVPSEGIFIELE